MDAINKPQADVWTGKQLISKQATMKMQIQGETLHISDFAELGAANSDEFRDKARAAMTAAQKNIDIDLSHTMFMDSCGLGTLISLHKTTCSRNGAVRLLNPTPNVKQVLDLTRMHRLFEIVNR
jgi:anti-sigma B factor antagonist